MSSRMYSDHLLTYVLLSHILYSQCTVYEYLTGHGCSVTFIYIPWSNTSRLNTNLWSSTTNVICLPQFSCSRQITLVVDLVT